MDIPLPSWPLLLWCGLAAAIASEWLSAALLPGARHARAQERAGAPRLLHAPRGSTPFAIVSGTLIFAPLYGLIFEWLQRADLEAGAITGAVHGVIAGTIVMIALLSSRARASPRPAAGTMAFYRMRRLVTRILYGALLGFLYVVPGPP